MGTLLSSRAALLLLPLALTIILCEPSHAEDRTGIAIGLRGGISGNSFLGEEAQEDYEQVDLVVTYELPWGLYHSSGWGFGLNLMASAGMLTGAGDTGLMSTVLPAITVGQKNGWFVIHAGGGAGLFSTHKFGVQDFGGPFQIVANTGITIIPFRPIGVGYQFQHFSDAALYGPDSRGVDMHLFELSYRF